MSRLSQDDWSEKERIFSRKLRDGEEACFMKIGGYIENISKFVIVIQRNKACFAVP